MSVTEDAEKLWYFVKTKDLEEVKKFLEEKDSVDLKPICEVEVNKIVWPQEQNLRDSFTCLHYGAKKGRTAILNELLIHHSGDVKRGVILNINVRSSVLGWTPLHYAVHGGRCSTVRLLIKARADLNVKANDGLTPVHVAVLRCQKRVLVTLANCGADMNVTDNNGSTVLHFCLESYQKGCCSENDCREMIEFLLTRGAKPTIVDINCNLPLHVAIRQNISLPILRLLASSLKFYNTDAINTLNKEGLAPIHLCKKSEDIKILISYGAKINVQTEKEKNSLLHMHASNYDMVTFIVSNGGDKMLKNINGEIPLHCAVKTDCPNLEVVKFLADDYKAVSAKDILGDTVIHKASMNNYKSVMYKDEKGSFQEKHLKREDDPVIEWLVTEKGANIDEKNNLGETALHQTVRARNMRKATILVLYGADLDVVDNKNTSPRKMDPAWAKRAIAFADFSDLESHTCGQGKTDRQSIVSGETTSTIVSNGTIKTSSQNKKDPKALPEWVNQKDNKGSQQNKNNKNDINKLKAEVDDVKNFLEEFSKEGDDTNLKKKKQLTLNREMTKLQAEMKDLNKMLQEVA